MISIVFCGDIRRCPYLLRYTERLENAKVEYEVLFWNRGALKPNLAANYKYFDKPSAEDLKKIRKLFDFWEFRRWVNKQLSRSKPNGIIFLSTLCGVLLWDVAKEYKNRYIFDIRDYSYENKGIFRQVEKKIIADSFFTTISSKGFHAFLPDYDYVVAHNFNRNDMVKQFSFVRQQEPYQIVWNGVIRFFDYQKQFLDLFKNDSRFLLVYHGEGAALENYITYCSENEINNVKFTGLYDNRDKLKLVRDASFLNNCYGDGNDDALKYAISNRFYDGLIYHIPQIVDNDGYKAMETKRLGVGLRVEPTKDLPEILYQYYNSLDIKVFNEACKKALEEIIAEDDLFIHKIDEFISTISKQTNNLPILQSL